MRVAFTTLGCKINQYETDMMLADFLSRGNTIVPFSEDADVYVINTCTVTARSDYQCRQAIRSAVRRGNGARVVVTGCYAETRPEEIQNIPGVDFVIGNRGKAAVADAVIRRDTAIAQTQSEGASAPLTAVRGRTRGFLKIQDGCDNSCSYCIVPFARGRSRSAETGAVIKEFERLVQEGCPEVVLTGIHIGRYGADLNNGMDLTRLLKTLIDKRGPTRIRLSSIEPKEITQEMIGLLGHGLCRHLHIPLQSGDDSILAAMKRDYTSGFYLDLLEDISKRVSGAALGADVMVGFPGEGEKEFQNTLSLIKKYPLTHLHVFSYSPRPGTAAAGMEKQVPEKAKKERSGILRELGRKKNFDFRKRFLGSELTVVVEGKKDKATGLFTGLTDNYIRVNISGISKEYIAKEIATRVIDVKDDLTFTEIC